MRALTPQEYLKYESERLYRENILKNVVFRILKEIRIENKKPKIKDILDWFSK